MRKKVLGLVMAALAVSTFGAFAQNEKPQIQKECCKENKECKKERKGQKDLKKAGKLNLFAGIDLTPDQQQKLDQLKEERKANNKAAKEAKKEAKANERKAYDNSIAQILTPEQYKQYESNKANLRAHKQAKMKKRLDNKAR